MSLVKAGKIHHCCTPNALMTLEEYLIDYASEDTRNRGRELIHREMEKVPEPVRSRALKYLEEIRQGGRDFRF